MAPITIPQYDLTLAEIDKALEQQEKITKPRHYLGMSAIGHPCWRYLFYSFRGAQLREISASGIRAIQDGFDQENKMAERLRMLPYIQLYTEDPNNPGSQIGFEMLLGHFRGHCDGAILGIIEAPKTWHTWEHKSVNETKFKQLVKARNDYGEKNALENWDETYYAQSQIYMNEMQLTRHYLTVTTPGGRDYISIRTEYKKSVAESIIQKAKSIIFDNWTAPAKLSEKREFYRCKWCEFQEVCHDGKFPLVNCKTCRYREPIDGGKHKCLYDDSTIPEEKLHLGCNNHVYNPALISAQLIEHQQDGCLYILENGIKLSNTSLSGMPDTKKHVDVIYTSQDLKDKIKYIHHIEREGINVQKEFDGTMVNDKSQKAWDGNNIDSRLKGI